MTLATLYKKTSTGAIQFWEISALTLPTSTESVSFIQTSFGQVGTENPQQTTDVIKAGKNIGKNNQTSISQQAELEAQAKWEKQKKKGYVESIEAAEANEVDALIQGGILPMLAHTFEKQGKKIKYPCYTQPKMDGIRCIAIVNNGKCTLWSRTRKPITSCPHIIEEIEKGFSKDVVLDGELFNNDFKDNFEHIVHLVRQEEPDPRHTDIQFHIYDLANNNTFEERCKELFRLLSPIKAKYLKFVDTFLVADEDQVLEYYDKFKRDGQEGAMLRNSNGLYVNKRSSDLIKVKEMQDEEFEIVGIEEGRGKLTGHVGSFVCKNEQGQEFKAKPSGATERLREYFCDHTLWQGKLLTVQFQDLTSYGIPRFPVGLRIKQDI